MNKHVKDLFRQCLTTAIQAAGGETVRADDGEIIFSANLWSPTDADTAWVCGQLAAEVQDAYTRGARLWDGHMWADADVHAAAIVASEYGRDAIAAFDAGEIEDAIKAADAAAAIEREYGDAPAWGPLANALHNYSDAAGWELNEAVCWTV